MRSSPSAGPAAHRCSAGLPPSYCLPAVRPAPPTTHPKTLRHSTALVTRSAPAGAHAVTRSGRSTDGTLCGLRSGAGVLYLARVRLPPATRRRRRTANYPPRSNRTAGRGAGIVREEKRTMPCRAPLPPACPLSSVPPFRSVLQSQPPGDLLTICARLQALAPTPHSPRLHRPRQTKALLRATVRFWIPPNQLDQRAVTRRFQPLSAV